MGGLMARDVSQQPQFVDVSAWEAAFLTNFPSMMTPPYEGRALDFRRPHRRSRAPMGYMACRDGYLWVAALQPRHWEGLTRVLGVPELADEPLFANPAGRAEYWDVLEPILAARLQEWTKDDLFHACQAVGVTVVPAYDMREAIESEQVRGTGFFVSVEHPVMGKLVMPGNPCRLGATPPHSAAAPRLGQHTDDVLISPRPHQDSAPFASPESELPLHGVRVLDLAWVLAGPLSSQILCRLGAEVIKVESDRVTDISRISPPFADGENHPEKSGYYAALAVGKKTCTIDMSKPEGLAIVKRLVELSDIVVENFSPGTLARMGLGYKELRRIRPNIILLSISALGQTGPLRSYRAFGLQLFAMSGLSILSAQPGAPPAVVRGGGADPVTGVYAALAALIALRHRNRTGEGQHIDISMLETTLAGMPDAAMEVTLNGRLPQPVGNAEAGHYPVDCFRCQGDDAWLAIAVHNDTEWRALCHALADSSMLEDPRFRTPPLRLQHREALARRIETWTSRCTAEDAMTRLQAAGVPAGVSYNDAEVQANGHFRQRGFMELVDHHDCGERYVAGVPWKISGVPDPSTPRRVPRWGEHNDYVLGELLGFSDQQVDQLIAAGVVSRRGGSEDQ
jgi:crotonobetainyl-CoA:carnitine CoA-transferase CaiB-like acyl-CoA transferase